jgi:hypothetical protein
LSPPLYRGTHGSPRHRGALRFWGHARCRPRSAGPPGRSRRRRCVSFAGALSSRRLSVVPPCCAGRVVPSYVVGRCGRRASASVIGIGVVTMPDHDQLAGGDFVVGAGRQPTAAQRSPAPRVCPGCGVEFTPEYDSRLYHSDQCRQAAKVRRRVRTPTPRKPRAPTLSCTDCAARIPRHVVASEPPLCLPCRTLRRAQLRQRHRRERWAAHRLPWWRRPLAKWFR